MLLNALLHLALLCLPFHAPLPSPVPAAALLHPVGGPPAIHLAGKAKGDITRAEWDALKAVELVGCVPDARITSLTISINEGKAPGETLNTPGAMPSAPMRRMIGGLSAGKTFTVKVVVKDGKDKVWEVAPAHYVWKG